MKQHTIAFIGAGNMARSLIGGLISDGYQPARIIAADPDQLRLQDLEQEFAIRTSTHNTSAVESADIVVIAVKPQVVERVAPEIGSALGRKDKLVISIAAGIRTATLSQWLGQGTPLVRAMPNTPALVQSAATVLYANHAVSTEQRDVAESVMRAVGLTLWIDDESLMDAVTALSGSGPAYFFLMMEVLEQAGRKLGLPPETARLLTLQTAFGATKMALESGVDSATLRVQVTSPGGTTERALSVLRDGGIEGLFERALKAARDRSVELSEKLGEHHG
ncbi:MAG: pyrroline-5-carboxylate reductase [Gammaproteobacteria bacterium]|nr:pyrroline-5-carboxylate reductase [Gammaproteobacteria bacterium]